MCQINSYGTLQVSGKTYFPISISLSLFLSLFSMLKLCECDSEQNNSLPFNKYAFLTTHNSFAIDGEPSHTGVPRVTLTNQEDNVTQQLNVSHNLV